MPSASLLDGARVGEERAAAFSPYNEQHTTIVLLATVCNITAMFRAAIRPATIAARSLKPATAVRTLAVSAVRRSGAPAPPLYPPGAKPGEVPTDDVHATGLERLQILGEKEGVKVFDYEPLDSSRVGTLADPIKVFSWVRDNC